MSLTVKQLLNEINMPSEFIKDNYSKFRPFFETVTESQRLVGKIAIASLQIMHHAAPLALAVFAATMLSPTALLITIAIGGIAGAALGLAFNLTEDLTKQMHLQYLRPRIFAIDFRELFKHNSDNFVCVNTLEKLNFIGQSIGKEILCGAAFFLAAKYLTVCRYITVGYESAQYGYELGAIAGRAIYAYRHPEVPQPSNDDFSEEWTTI